MTYIFVCARIFIATHYVFIRVINIKTEVTEKSETHVLPIISSSVFIWSTMGYTSSDFKK